MKTKKKCKMIGFTQQLSGDFPIEFGLPGWHIIDWEERDEYDPDYYFQVNVKKPSADPEIYDYIQESGKPYLVAELSMFRKNSYTHEDKEKWYYTLGWYHFLRNGEFNNAKSPSDRWLRIQEEQEIEVKPWRTKKSESSTALLCLQKAGDSTLNTLYETFPKYSRWVYGVTKAITFNHPDLPVIIRPHIKTGTKAYHKTIQNIDQAKLSGTWFKRTQFEGGAGLQKDFDKAWFVIAYNSNVLTQAVLEGIPSYCFDRNGMAYPACLPYKNLSKPHKAKDIDRTQWLRDSAYTQWTIAEIRDGQAWDHLKSVVGE